MYLLCILVDLLYICIISYNLKFNFLVFIFFCYEVVIINLECFLWLLVLSYNKYMWSFVFFFYDDWFFRLYFV